VIHLHTNTNQPIDLADILGKGGEATIYQVANHPAQVAKLYHHPTTERLAKLAAMLANPPSQQQHHTAIAWPTDLLYQDNQFVGFLMSKVSHSKPIFQVYHPQARQQHFSSFTWQALHRVAYNTAVMMSAIHAKGYVIGDINESNILVNSQGLVTIVDTDSFQVVDETGQIHRCKVGKPEYTPPELQGVSFSQIDQTIEHDLFGLGVLLFQLLMEGYHPFAGVLTSRLSVGRVDLYAIREGLFPYGADSTITPPPAAPSFAMLHSPLKEAFEQCFEQGHHQPVLRPEASQWAIWLNQAENALTTCSEKIAHVYSNHSDHCPWCQRQTGSIAKSSSKSRPTPQPISTKKPKPPQTPSNKQTIYQPPEKMTITQDGQDLMITRQWFEWQKFILLFCGTLFWNGFVWFFLYGTYSDLREFPFFLIFHILGGVWLIYQTLAIWFNQTMITVNQNLLTAYTHPVSVSGRTEILILQIRQLFCKQHVRRNKNGKTITYAIYVLTRTGEHRKLAGSFSSYQQVRYIEQEIQKYLNLPDNPVSGEYIE